MTKTTTPNMFEMWTKLAEEATETMFETMQKSIDQTFTLTARTTDMMVAAARQAQQWGAQEQARAFEMMEAAQTQAKEAAERSARMAKTFSAN